MNIRHIGRDRGVLIGQSLLAHIDWTATPRAIPRLWAIRSESVERIRQPRTRGPYKQWRSRNAEWMRERAQSFQLQ